jgi:hypothetical protein
MTEQQQAIAALIEAVEAGGSIPKGLRSRALGHVGSASLAHLANRGSLNAALALHEALLPGWHFDVATEANSGFYAHVSPKFLGRISHISCSTTPARALLLAILKAYNTTLGEVAA